MRIPPNVTALLFVTLLGAPSARAADSAAIAAAKRELQSAVSRSEVTAMQKSRAHFDALAVADPQSALLHYWIAVADWRITPLLGATDREKAARTCQDGLTHCDQALAIDPKMAEAIALKGGLQGMSIQFDPKSMMTLGAQSVANTRRGATLSPNSPRAWLFDGIGTLNKPEQYGGGAVPAGEAFERAMAAVAADTSADPAAPDWGHDDAYLWAGRAAMARKDPAAARELYRRALVLNPDNAWVRARLLPEAEKAIAAAARPATGDEGKPPAAKGDVLEASARAKADTATTGGGKP